VEPLPVGLVIVTEYHPGATWRPRTLTSGRALLALMDNTVAARRDPVFAMAILKQVVSGSQALRGRRGEAGAVVPALFRRLSRTTQPSKARRVRSGAMFSARDRAGRSGAPVVTVPVEEQDVYPKG
jgi:hypothetical protein